MRKADIYRTLPDDSEKATQHRMNKNGRKTWMQRLRAIAPPISTRTAVVLAIAIVLGYAGNHFSFPLFFGVDFLFGSIAVLVVVGLYGTAWGTIVALITSLYTIQLWGHPYAVISLTLEAFFVGCAMRRKHRNLVLIDGIYWACIGMPLVWVFYAQVMALPTQVALLILLKQSINGMFNALIAGFLLTYPPLHRVTTRSKDTATLSLQQILSNVMVAIVFLPVLTLMVVDSRLEKHSTEVKIQANLQAVSNHLIDELRVWQHYRSTDIESFIRYLRPESYPGTIITLFDRDGRAKAIANLTPSLQTLPNKQQGEVRPLSAGVYQWLPAGDIPPLARWRQSFYVREIPIFDSSATLAIAVPAAPYINSLQSLYIRSLGIMAVVIGFALLVASLLSHYFTRPLAKLAVVTTNLPDKLLDRDPISLPQTSIAEINLLVENVRIMAAALEQKFQEIHRAKEQLEERVRERTQELAAANLDLEAEVADRKRAEAEIRASQQRLALFVEQTPVGVIEWDTACKVTAWNRSAERIFGYGADEAIGRDIIEMLVPAHVAEYVRQLMDRLFDQPNNLHSINENITKAGSTVMCEWYNSSLIDTDGKLVGVTSMVMDVSDRKRAEAQLKQQAEDLENAVKELQQTQIQLVHSEKMSGLGQLVAGVAHEINNPVNFIYGNLIYLQEYTQDLLGIVRAYQQHYPQPVPEVQDLMEAADLEFLVSDIPKMLASMRVGADRIHGIVQSLRNFSRLDEAEMKAIDIHEGIDNTLMILQNRIKEKPGEKVVEIIKEYSQLPLVECYPGELNQVFMNLLANALDALDNLRSKEHAPDASPPTIRIRTEIATPDRVRISIADNGSGVPLEVQQRLFDPFFTTKPVGKGTGLGLSISYQVVVDRHKGSLSCVSEPDKGAAFLIEIPLRQV